MLQQPGLQLKKYQNYQPSLPVSVRLLPLILKRSDRFHQYIFYPVPIPWMYMIGILKKQYL